MKTTFRQLLVIFVIVVLSACTQKKNDLRIAAESEPTTPVTRSEPIFYNGKTYRFDLAKAQDGGFALAVSGMGAKQQKDAVAVATSSLRYFACKDSQSSKLSSPPRFEAGKWRMQARCV